MKNYLKITNQGVLDIRLIALMGGTTKKDNNFKIGQFGTGLKYVLAYLIRNGIEYHIFCGEKKVSITTESEIIDGTEFNIICIEGHRTSITTNMGDDWKPWMIVREIYSNALDEGGENYELTNEITSAEGVTSYYLEMTPDIMRVYNNWDKYFIVKNIPMFENESFAVHPSGERLKFYKHGILIFESEHENSVFNYDIKDASINELREYRGNKASDLYHIICNLDSKSIEYFLENCTKNHFEGAMDYSWDWLGDGMFSEEWEKTIGSAKIIHKEALDNIKARGLDLDISSVVEVPKVLYKALTKKFKGIGALRVADKVGDFFETHNDILTQKLDKCVKILEDANYFMAPELTFTIGVFGDSTVLARINPDSKEIFISEKHAEKSTFDTCTMLIEENEHFRTGFQDHSRAFQQHFIDMFTNKLFDKANIDL